MTMFENLQLSDLLMTESQLMSLRAASRARTSALRASAQALPREPDLASGESSPDLLASYDRNTSSWRTSQGCLMALLSDQGHGLAEFSETWPSAGMMRSGRTFRRQPWALPIAESVSGLLPTPRANDAEKRGNIANDKRNGLAAYARYMVPTPTATDWKRSPIKLQYANRPYSEGAPDDLAKWAARDGGLNHSRLASPLWEYVMGFPKNWARLEASETP